MDMKANKEMGFAKQTFEKYLHSIGLSFFIVRHLLFCFPVSLL